MHAAPGRWYLVVLLAAQALAAGAQEVTLPLTQYEDLRSRANPAVEVPVKAPAPFALELADFDVKAGAESARVVQTLRFTLFDDQWQTVPLGEAGSFIRADFGGAEGRVQMVKEGGWSLQVRGRGRHEVKLESVVPVTRDETATRPTWRLGFKAPMAAVVRGRLEAPEGVEDVAPQGPVLIDRLPTGGWRFAAPAGADIRCTLSGKAVVPRRAQLPLRFEATTATASTVVHTRFKVLAWVEVRVAQGRLETLRVPIPADLEVVQVRGPVTDWKMDGQMLVVTPLAAVEDSLAFELDLAGDPRERFATPLLIPAGSARTTLLAKAHLQGDGILSLSDKGAARAAAEGEAERLPGSLRSASGVLFAVTDPARPPAWEAAWAERTEMLAAQVDRLLVDVSVGEAGKASYQLWAEIRNRGAQQLSFTLPPGFELVEAQRDGVPVAPGTTAGSGVAVPLLTQEAPQVVHLLGVVPFHLPAGTATFEVVLPALSAPAAKVEVRAVLPGGRSYELTDVTRAGGVAPPPRTAVRATDNVMARQVASSPRTVSSAAAAFLFPCPSGFVQIGASWSALSATPLPLSLRAKEGKEKVQWF
jgi:hypothetical protein